MAKGKKAAEQEGTDLALVKDAEDTSSTYLKVISDLTVSTQDDVDACGEMQREVFQLGKRMKLRLKEITDPLLQAERSARNLFKPGIQLCEKVEAICKQRLGEHELRQLQAQRAALQEIQERGSEASDEALAIAHGAERTAPSEAVNVKRVFTFKIVDAEAIEEKYFDRVLNEKRIQAEIDASGGKAQIAGVEVVEGVKVSNKAVR